MAEHLDARVVKSVNDELSLLSSQVQNLYSSNIFDLVKLSQNIKLTDYQVLHATEDQLLAWIIGQDDYAQALLNLVKTTESSAFHHVAKLARKQVRLLRQSS